MKKALFFAVLLSLLYSCTSNTIYEKPKDLIPKDSMVILLKDLYLASSAKAIKNKNLQRKISYLPLIYDTYKIDSLRFNTSNIYYTSKVDEFIPMLNKVKVLLEKEQATYSKIKKVRDSTRNDSIQKVKARILTEQKKNKPKIGAFTEANKKEIMLSKEKKKKSN